jgi:hypothetical protein
MADAIKVLDKALGFKRKDQVGFSDQTLGFKGRFRHSAWRQADAIKVLDKALGFKREDQVGLNEQVTSLYVKAQCGPGRLSERVTRSYVKAQCVGIEGDAIRILDKQRPPPLSQQHSG